MVDLSGTEGLIFGHLTSLYIGRFSMICLLGCIDTIILIWTISHGSSEPLLPWVTPLQVPPEVCWMHRDPANKFVQSENS